MGVWGYGGMGYYSVGAGTVLSREDDGRVQSAWHLAPNLSISNSSPIPLILGPTQSYGNIGILSHAKYRVRSTPS